MLTDAQILEALKDCNFNNLTEDNMIHNVIDFMDSTIFPHSYWDSGATKLVLTPPKEDFVIKIPLCGLPNNNFIRSYNDEEPEYYRFENAEEPCGWNYCEVEVLKYALAKEAGLGHLFAETRLVGYVHDYPIYIQPKAKIFCNERCSYSREKREKTIDTCDDLNVYCFHASWLSDFLEWFSPETLQKLDDWLINNHVRDLHGGNLGYSLLTGQPIIVDYSDFND